LKGVNNFISIKYVFVTIFFILALGIFLIDTYYVSFDFTPDDIMYALDTENGPVDPGSFWRSAHLLWSITTHGFYRIWVLLGYNKGAIYPMQILNIIFMALSVGFFSLLIYKITRDMSISIIFSLLFHFSSWAWNAALHPKFYCSALLFQILAVYILFCTPRREILKPVLVGFFQSLAVLFNFITIFLTPAPLLFFLLENKGFLVRIRNSIMYILTGTIILISVFLYIYSVLMGCHLDFNNFMDWLIMRKSTTGAFAIQRSLKEYLMFLNVLIIANTSAEFPYTLNLSRWIPNFFIIRDFLYLCMVAGLLFPLAGLIACYMQKLSTFIRSLSMLFNEVLVRWRDTFKYFIFGVLGLLLTLGGFYIVDIHNGFLFLILIFFYLLLGVSMANLKAREIKGFSSMVRNSLINFIFLTIMLLIFWININIKIIPGSQLTHNKELVRVLSFKNDLNFDDTIVTLGLIPDSVYFYYFLGCRVIDASLFFQIFNPVSLPGKNPYEEIAKSINNEIRSRRVFLYSTFFRSSTKQFFKGYPPWMGMDYYKLQNLFKLNYKMEIYKQYDHESILYRLIPRGGGIYIP